jgi:CheY-like chemotaxis protein
MKDLSESRVLIVDDVKTNVDILVQALRDEYKLSVALDGNAALRSVEKSCRISMDTKCAAGCVPANRRARCRSCS